MPEDSARPAAPDPRTPPPPAPPAPPPPPPPPPPARPDRPAWRVQPAPDGRGKPPEKTPMLPWRPGRFIAILVVLLALNYLIVAIFAPTPSRPDISYSPFFLQQVRAGGVKEISATGEEVKGTFNKKIDVPDDGSG